MPDIDLKQDSPAGAIDAPHVAELAAQLANTDVEAARTARRALWRIVRHVGRPGAHAERQAVVSELETKLTIGQPAAVYREVLWMLSEIGTRSSVASIAALLSNATAREDARMALERIPGDESFAALNSALDQAPDDFKLNLAQSLRARGAEVPGLPCEKLKPTKPTHVKAT